MNLTLAIDDEVAERAREVARVQGMSLNELVRQYLARVAGPDREELARRYLALDRHRDPSGEGERTWTRDEIYQERLHR